MAITYELKGFYNYRSAPSGTANLTGKISVDEEGHFGNRILDSDSPISNQFIKGHLIQNVDLAQFVFTKTTRRHHPANLFFSLNKDFEEGFFEGEYLGRWGIFPYEIKYNEDFDLFVAGLDLRTCEVGGATSIKLYRK